MEVFVFVLEMIGVVAFAFSGAVEGIRKNMDVFGVCVLALTTSCGGGLLRDLLLGQLPPAMFRDPTFGLTSIVTALLVFLFFSVKGAYPKSKLFDWVLILFDSVGLGLFTVVGVSAVFNAGFGDNFFFTVFLGTVTGVGGGVFRDIIAQNTPYIFVKHVYASASMLGAVVCFCVRLFASEDFAILVGSCVVIIIRLLAAKFRWSLPKTKINEESQE